MKACTYALDPWIDTFPKTDNLPWDFLAFLGLSKLHRKPQWTNPRTYIDQTPLRRAYCDTSKAKIGPGGLGSSWIVWLRIDGDPLIAKICILYAHVFVRWAARADMETRMCVTSSRHLYDLQVYQEISRGWMFWIRVIGKWVGGPGFVMDEFVVLVRRIECVYISAWW